MRPGRAYQIVSWGAAIAMALILIVEWVALFRLHAAGPIAQIDRKTILSKELVEGLGFAVLAILALGVIWRAWRRSAPILVRESLDASAALGRRESASTATGYHEVHTREQARLAGEAVGP